MAAGRPGSALRVALAGALLAGGLAAAERPAPLPVHRAAGEISIDGDLSDAGWRGAATIDTFYETSPGDNVPARVKTVVHIAYDQRYLYIGVWCEDPDPAKIRAPYVDRDNVIGTDDNVAVFLDTRNSRQSAVELRVNPRGIQGDAVYNDANQHEDFSPDFFYDTAARITSSGWSAEYRIPFSSLRYPRADPQTWGILVWRNYPREFRYAFHSAPIPRDSSCFICHAHELTGLAGLPSASHLSVAPYATAHQAASRTEPGDPRSPLTTGPLGGDAGADVKWNPTAGTSVDATLHPDFSQIESDVPQIAVNQRFALSYPEKRPFFLEGVDLFDTPIPAVYTRSITSPSWGLRATGKQGDSDFTLLAAEDRGGGLAILPGPIASDFAPQDFRSLASLGRWRRDMGQSFAGLLATDREVSGGGFNRVIGPDFVWRAGGSDVVTGQYLYSASESPDRPDLAASWRGQRFSSFAGYLNWSHQTQKVDWALTGRDFGDGFRADDGFVPQVGFREGTGSFGLRFWPQGLLSFVRAYAAADVVDDRDGRPIDHNVYPGILVMGRRNLVASAELHDEELATAHRLLSQRYLTYSFEIDPSRRVSRILVTGTAGEGVDIVNERVGHGATVTVEVSLRPFDRLELVANGSRQWLDERAGERSGRLFTAGVERLKATYFFSPRAFVRAIGQLVDTRRDPLLYTVPVESREGSTLASLLYAYRLSWQSVLFVGCDEQRLRTPDGRLLVSDRTVFLKVSYAFQL
ncbi:MAG TPA: DUF5916 domain-containing protein [Solirubrobacterales bacterium]|nr:DUF5916 domain-containing protein [Solirubrobacterales bacterium]